MFVRATAGVTIACATALLVSATTVRAEEPRIAFPANYRTAMINYLSLDRVQNDDQVIRLFTSKAALDAGKAGKPIPYGTVIVAEIYKAKKNAKGEVIESSLGRRIRDKFAAVAVMQKEKGWGEKFSDEHKNGDWDFAIFSPKGERLVKKDLNACRACHAPLKETQHLFSLEHMTN